MNRYTVTFFAEVEGEIEAESAADAKEKAYRLLGEHRDKRFRYAYLSDIKNVVNDYGNEF